ncbi:WD40-repeat-containing domain protein [Crucibulum laeve]|uniref:WD40-repeat-containing domain protein n=1 Tax=Crucibulum laeve TaxID=68775 RepID=A0A5C3LSQ8_9AGAR|nr:WD40-repeat-containing domain protein [Crucibulum laeve]
MSAEDPSTSYAEYKWVPPQYDISKSPCIETTLGLASDPESPENFARSAKWSPDGSVLLAHCENRTFQFFDIPSIDQGSKGPSTLQPIRTFHQPAPILDFLWYPTATPRDPASFCFISSVRECPVKLLDASDGRLRASYRIVDHRERQIAPHSLAFNLTADKLYCGFEDAIEVFDVSRPGEGTRLPTTPSKKSKDGLKGIISALSFSPSYGSDGFYAAGCLSPTPSNIAIFTEAQGEVPVMFVGGGPRAGVTQIQFNPTQPHMMYAAFRRTGAVYSWDLRAAVDKPLKIYQAYPLSVHNGLGSGQGPETNQKMRFDIDIVGQRLGIGDQKGNISLFDISTPSTGVDDPVAHLLNPLNPLYSDGVVEEVAPSLKFNAHKDAVGSIAFHPLRPIIASVSGSRHFLPEADSDHSEDDDSDSDDDIDTQELMRRKRPVTRLRIKPHPVTLDSSIKIWNCDAPTSTDGPVAKITENESMAV